MVKLFLTDKAGVRIEVDAKIGWSVMESIRDVPHSVEAVCGGMCACATCHVHVDPHWMAQLPPRRYEERAMLVSSPAYDPARSRLSCQITVSERLDGLVLAVPKDS